MGTELPWSSGERHAQAPHSTTSAGTAAVTSTRTPTSAECDSDSAYSSTQTVTTGVHKGGSKPSADGSGQLPSHRKGATPIVSTHHGGRRHARQRQRASNQRANGITRTFRPQHRVGVYHISRRQFRHRRLGTPVVRTDHRRLNIMFILFTTGISNRQRARFRLHTKHRVISQTRVSLHTSRHFKRILSIRRILTRTLIARQSTTIRQFRLSFSLNRPFKVGLTIRRRRTLRFKGVNILNTSRQRPQQLTIRVPVHAHHRQNDNRRRGDRNFTRKAIRRGSP